MTALRIFIGYEPADKTFATKLTIDLQAYGAEITTDSTDIHDTAFEQFLNEKLPQSQQLIVVQTPEAFQSPRMQAIVDTALKHVQEGRMAGVLFVIARTFDEAEEQTAPLASAMAASGFDASQDYPRALARLRLYLGLTDTNGVSYAPPPASHRPPVGSPMPTGAGEKPFGASLQQADVRDRPIRPLRRAYVPLRSRFILFSLALVLVLVLLVAGGTAFLRWSPASVKSPPSTPTTLAAPTTPAPIDATKLTPVQLYDAVTSRPAFYRSDLGQQDKANWDQGNRCQFTGSAYQASMPAQRSIGLQTCFERTFLFSDFAFQARMTILSGTNHDGGGLLFRAQNGDYGYRFHVGIDGSYDLTDTSQTILHGIDPALKHTTLLTVIAQGPLIFLYVNKQLLAQTRDTFSAKGQLGFMAVSFSQSTSVTLTNAQVWTL
ncbi:hypothetical protein KSD_01760 [Ktedonobacter sp. SOSP1-85]|uniref:toll/interleukin-1 receptor domain-containing protein n=1 Tax=Ktedonobacter sp. SOSP1-85 TaxID=2778367 RepID=UPI001915A131|nr:toll/interleukin-1 receptor domain-containing protein [Ktedonobacter sp. SOSP1-85]GHO72405.1 hypothetical protein KSD_01760 [Ktedonobacter sp. SOSP1-85]